jgi:formyl-CoA transferase
MTDARRRPYRTKDGYIGVLVYNDKQWRRFFALAGRPELADDPRFNSMSARTRNIGAIYDLLTETFATKTTAEWARLLNEADIPAAPLNTPEGLVEDAHMQAVDFFRLADHPSEGRIRVMAIPQTWSESRPEIRHHAPRIGEHTAELLAEYGFKEREVEGLIASGIAIACD